jgi:hypothetical protein
MNAFIVGCVDFSSCLILFAAPSPFFRNFAHPFYLNILGLDVFANASLQRDHFSLSEEAC